MALANAFSGSFHNYAERNCEIVQGYVVHIKDLQPEFKENYSDVAFPLQRAVYLPANKRCKKYGFELIFFFSGGKSKQSTEFPWKSH